MINVEIIEFTDKYIDDVTEISKLSFKIPWSRESIEKELKNPFSKYVLAKVDNEIIGFGGMWFIVDEGHITNIAVHSKFRGLGIGSALLSSLINICKECNGVAMTLEVRFSNIAAQALYSKFGFKNEGVRKKYYSDNGEDAIIMWKHGI
ncbi:ribosomal protein S18-alanine N-acetyltransferase [Clostridium frigidicarnis]|uniref:[Ribosomal protein bS18]-alanine N-acetyltransferase n=1 Tax=Clostridium frigidicarnis TaxID=84698 RepID=A0A1I0XZS8_9CLOT|nr:ribosomal protein S18-alanine N-acetyltransferase [Clostridium frigidicarnis]SFB06535.1 [SSU ribosomal protein S18P]-alanine acetyltransferase [Clostridium frigidicarnis]